MKKGKGQERVLYYATHLLDRRETIQRWPTVHDLKLREGLVRVENDQQICTRSFPSSEALVQDV